MGPGAQLQPTSSCNNTGHKAATRWLGTNCTARCALPADVLGLAAHHARLTRLTRMIGGASPSLAGDLTLCTTRRRVRKSPFTPSIHETRKGSIATRKEKLEPILAEPQNDTA